MNKTVDVKGMLELLNGLVAKGDTHKIDVAISVHKAHVEMEKLQEQIVKLESAIDIAILAFGEIVADGSYKDIASEISCKALDDIRILLPAKDK